MILRTALIGVLFAVVATACSSGDATFTVYSGRSEELVAPLLETFEQETGIVVEVRYGDSAELAATILEEGDNSPADVFFAQDPASLGAVKQAGLFDTLDGDIIALVPTAFSDVDQAWVGLSGRARVVVYDTTKVDPTELPATEDGLTAPEWARRVGVAPTNGSFLAFVAAKILLDGEAATLTWLQEMAANDSPTFTSNSVIVAATNNGEVDTGLVNHYYLFRLIAEEGAAEVVAANHFMTGGGAGSLVMPAGAGILASTDTPDDAEAFVDFLLSDTAQTYFRDETYEYPLVATVEPNRALPPLESLNPPDINLSDLAGVLDLATELVAEAGLL